MLLKRKCVGSVSAHGHLEGLDTKCVHPEPTAEIANRPCKIQQMEWVLMGPTKLRKKCGHMQFAHAISCHDVTHIISCWASYWLCSIGFDAFALGPNSLKYTPLMTWQLDTSCTTVGLFHLLPRSPRCHPWSEPRQLQTPGNIAGFLVLFFHINSPKSTRTKKSIGWWRFFLIMLTEHLSKNPYQNQSKSYS